MAEGNEGNSMTMEEMEAADAAAKAAEPVKVDPATQEAQDRIKRLEDSLRASEEARIRGIAENAARAAAPAPAPVEPAAPEGPKDLTAEELDQLVREDPTKALQLAMEQTRRVTTRDLEARIGPLVNAGVTSAEQMARQKFANDFEILGPEIKAFLDTIPEGQKRAALGDVKGWETMLNYVRGQNMDKIVNARVDKAVADRLGAARGEQVAGAPTNIASAAVVNPPAATSGGVIFDATTIEIMKTVLNCEDTPKARAEWVKWSNATKGA